ncbi:MAG: ATP-binding cassette, subfamily bacterial [Acidimicrobiia bacterium]|nr:ATP-binding cassette, subfamily bacterial [Acidimicrobiia bacterium]
MRVQPPDPDDLPTTVSPAWSVLVRALRHSRDLRRGLGFTLALALVTAVGRVSLPVLVQQVIDKGIVNGYRPTFVRTACAVAVVLGIGIFFASRATMVRLTRAAEATLYRLRVDTFEHIHRLSLAAHTESRRGVWLARVTSDIETIERFVQWGALSWIVDTMLIVVVLAVMTAYSWQLVLVALACLLPMVPVLRFIQRRQALAYAGLRDAVGDTLGQVSESLMGAATIRAYGMQPAVRLRVHRAVRQQYRRQMKAARWMSVVFTVGDVFGALTLATVAAVGAWFGPGWGIAPGTLVACLFLVNQLQMPVNELGEVLDQTQIAIAGWRKVLDVLDVPVEVVEPEDGIVLPTGPLAVAAENVRFAYADGPPVLVDVTVELNAGSHVAVVGETGSGKTTFAKLLCRLADPLEGSIRVAGQDLREVSPESRRSAIRLVPQDGFLFDTTVGENVRMGRPGATERDAGAAFQRLGLDDWLASLPLGLDTPVGERGEQLSVGERQLVALARAQLADPGLLVLDEATSAIDAETERALSRALGRLSEGRTTISVAHRLSTAEGADVVLVFDRGRLVERGTHHQLVESGGVYAGLYQSWLGNTRTTPSEPAPATG